MKKKCTKCHIIKDESEFNKDKRASTGLQSCCKQCHSEDRKKSYKQNSEKVLQRGRAWKNKNKDKLYEYGKEYYKEKSKLIQAQRKKNREKNIDLHRKKVREYFSKKRKTDFLFKLKENLRNLIRQSFKKKNVKKPYKLEQILGCSFSEFKIYIESKFEPWMSWENHGLYNGQKNYGWDIDHIICLAEAKTKDDLIHLNHFTNLQPLCSYTNRYIKSAQSW